MNTKNRAPECILASLALLLSCSAWRVQASAPGSAPGRPSLTSAGENRFSRPRPLPPAGGGWRERTLPGLTRHYEVSLETGQFLHVEVKQEGVDIVLRLFGGEELLEVDSLTGTRGTEDLFFVAPGSGRYRLEVRADEAEKEVGIGTYEIRTLARRPATPLDSRRAWAAGRFSRARKLERSNPAAATSLFTQAAEVWQEVGETGLEGQAWERLARAYARIPGRDAERRSALERALALHREADAFLSEAAVLSHLGSLASTRQDFVAASRYFERSISLFAKVEDLREVARRRNDLAFIRVRQGGFDEAVDLYRLAIEALEKAGDPSSLATAHFNLGVFHSYLDQKTRAERQLRRALKLFRATGDGANQAKVLSRLGETVLGLYGPAKALPYLESALTLREELGDLRGKGVTLIGIGLAHLSADRPREAKQALHQALFLLEAGGGTREDRAVALLSLGDFYERLGKASEARALYLRALPLARGSSVPRIESALELALARLDWRQKRLGEALERLEDLSSAGDSWGERVFLEERNDLLIDVLADLHVQDPGAGYDSRAFAVCESNRARSLHALAKRAGSRPDPKELARLDEASRQVRSRLPARTDISWNHGGDDLGYALDRFWRSRPAPPPSPLSLEEVQEKFLDEETLLLEYHLGETRSLLWAVSRQESRLVFLEGRATIEDAAEVLRKAIDDAPHAIARSRYDVAAERLSRLLLQPVADRLDKKRLVVVAPGSLRSIPFHALPHPASPAVPLAETHEVVSEPSITLLAALRERKRSHQPASRLLAVVADPVFGDDDERLSRKKGVLPPSGTSRTHASERFERLAHTGHEASAILEMAGFGPKLAARGFDANRNLVMGGSLYDYQILHFATHGEYDDRFPELSSLILSQLDASGRKIEGRLRAFEIFGLDLRADLVVLSACRTAWNEGERGEGRAAGLAQGFLHAGAPRVVVSLWEVDDRATTALMKHFYGGILDLGLSPAEALRRAQLRIRREKDWQSPYYWAGFVLQGDWQ